MPKRKRPHPPAAIDAAADGGADEPARAMAMRQEAVQKKIHHADVVFRRALKICRTFEAQKIGRRIRLVRREGGLRLFKPKKRPRTWEREQAAMDKIEREAQREAEAAEGDRETLQRISEEVALEKEDERILAQMTRFLTEQKALKDIDLGVVSQIHLYKTLLKKREVTNSPYFPADRIREELERVKAKNYCAKNSLPDKEDAARTVAARLYDANKARAAFKSGLRGIYQALGLEVEESEGHVDVKKSKTDKKGEDVVMRDDEEKEEEQNEDSDSDGEEIDGEDTELDDEMLDALDARIAKSDDEGEEEQGDVGDPRNVRGHSMSITPEPADGQPAAESSDSPDFSDEGSELSSSPSVSTEPEKKSKKSKSTDPPAEKASKSSFLPTLMSGYISGSGTDSESKSDSNKKRKKKKQKKGPPEKKERKNRMGQQARRALAEKKYGQKANHILKEKEAKEEKKRKKEGKKMQWQEKQAKPVHPSWQAAKSAQEQKDRILKEAISASTAGGANPVKGVGKKIVFDD